MFLIYWVMWVWVVALPFDLCPSCLCWFLVLCACWSNWALSMLGTLLSAGTSDARYSMGDEKWWSVGICLLVYPVVIYCLFGFGWTYANLFVCSAGMICWLNWCLGTLVPNGTSEVRYLSHVALWVTRLDACLSNSCWYWTLPWYLDLFVLNCLFFW
jgi:hypothetical protein